jgi:hypothetical protein
LKVSLRWTLGAVVAVGAVLRIVWALRMEPPAGLADPFFYLSLGDNLADGRGYSYLDMGANDAVSGYVPTAYYPPGYPLFLAAVFRAGGLFPGDPSPFALAVGANVVLSVLLIGLVFSLGRRLASPGVGLVAAVVVAVWPNLVFHSGVVLTETLFLVLFVLMLLVALATPEIAVRPGWRRVAAIGVLLGLVGLVRPVSLIMGPLFLVLWSSSGVGSALRRCAVVGVACMAVLAPWAIASTRRMDSLVLVSLNVGDNLCIGYHEGADGSFVRAPACLGGYEHLDRPEYETRRQEENIDRALTYIRGHPLDALSLVPARARVTLRHDADGVAAAEDFGSHAVLGESVRSLLGNVADGYYLLMMALGAGGVILVARCGLWSDHSWRFLLLSAPVQLLSPLMTFGDPRFKMPIYPAVAVCAAVAIVAMAHRIRSPNADSNDKPDEVREPAAIT